MNIYYIYFYLRDDFTPYYVGKGKEKRAWAKHQSGIKLPKDRAKIIIVHDNLSELQSFILERYYIRWFGRKDTDTGILRNRTDGADGGSGYKHTEEHKKYISAALKKYVRTEDHNNAISKSKKGIIPSCTYTRRSFSGKNNPNYGKKRPEVGTINHLKHSKKYIVDGKEYLGLSEVMVAYNLNSKAAVHYRIKSNSEQFIGWKYVN